MQIPQQPHQGFLLRFRACVAGCASVGCEATHVGHPDRVQVVVLAMRSRQFLRPAPFQRAVGRDHIMVSTVCPAQRPMVTGYIRHAEGTARPVGGTVHND